MAFHGVFSNPAFPEAPTPPPPEPGFMPMHELWYREDYTSTSIFSSFVDEGLNDSDLQCQTRTVRSWLNICPRFVRR
jgi:hypothetical protein